MADDEEKKPSDSAPIEVTDKAKEEANAVPEPTRKIGRWTRAEVMRLGSKTKRLVN